LYRIKHIDNSALGYKLIIASIAVAFFFIFHVRRREGSRWGKIITFIGRIFKRTK